jgi:hypothetical protein
MADWVTWNDSMGLHAINVGQIRRIQVYPDDGTGSFASVYFNGGDVEFIPRDKAFEVLRRIGIILPDTSEEQEAKDAHSATPDDKP